MEKTDSPKMTPELSVRLAELLIPGSASIALKYGSIFVILLMSCMASYSQTARIPKQYLKPAWYEKFKRVRIFESTRSEVERLFGNPKIEYTYAGEWSVNVDYKLKQGELTVYYSSGRCSLIKDRPYDVDKDIVIGLDMKLKDEAKISDLGINISDFNRYELRDLPGSFSYVNKKQGIMMAGTSKTISRIDRDPTQSQESALRCSK